ncbi:MAG TPA: ROK family transcriptional regulator [Jatrophihabitantaceae bacterium]|nr:ROK family transcriptional regulator [Jatrophihabitantaceae bacterium]
MSAVPMRYELPDSARAVLRALATAGPATRPALGDALGLSKPTMSTVIAELTRLDLVAEQGSSRGATGRSAVVYSLAATAGHVLGVDVGATRVRVSAHNIDGQQLASAEQRVSQRRHNVTPASVRAATDLVAKVRAKIGDTAGPLRDVVVATPTVPSHDVGDSLLVDGVEGLPTALGLPDDVPVIVENNVNCAAIAEHRTGAARDQSLFAYLQVGVKIGAGVVIDGKLLRGAHGAGGEVTWMPFPWSSSVAPRRGELEDYLGSDALMQRAHQAWPAAAGPAPTDAEALFAAAGRGDAAARRLVDAHSRDIARLVVGVMSVVDPGLVVLGGGVGQNPLVLPEVRRVVRALAWNTEITTGALGEQATVLGAVHVAISRSLDRIA